MFLENFRKFIKYYGQEQRIKLAGFAVLSFIAGCLEFIGIALIYPFILLIIQPEMFNSTFKFIHIENTVNNGLLIGLFVLILFIFKNTFIVMTLFIQNKFINGWRQNIINKFIKFYIYAPYKETMKIPATNKIYILQTICGQVIDNFVMRALNFLTNAIIIFMIISLLLIKYPVPAMVTIVFVCITMYIQNKYFKSKTAMIANVLNSKYQKYSTTLLDTINNIKDLKILSSENIFYEKFLEASKSIKEINSIYGFYAGIPPYIVEILVVSALLVMALILSIQNINNNSTLIASFAIVVAALFRIAPALNRIQTSIININASRNFVRLLNEEYEKNNLADFKETNQSKIEKINFFDKIQVKNIKFSYTENKQVIKNISFEIKKGDFIGIIGLSGAGKSTLADILTGLLPVDSGKILIDNTELTQENFPSFRKILGYVPQQINILDTSIKENVAWGCETINEKGVIKALKAAQLYDTINEYPEGINANIIIGSNGLSQGQKQRLAIARALYRDPEILLFDEATSALDVQVENEITEMLKQIGQSKTIIAIAHRLSTLKACNKLIYLKDGQIVDIGTFEELSSRYEDFANLIKLSKIN